MTPWISIEELRGVCNLDLFTASVFDRELLMYLRAAQGFAEKYCSRLFDGTTSRAEYHEFSQASNKLLLRNTPVLSVTSIYNDPSLAFDSSTLIPSTDYMVIPDSGIVQLKDSDFLDLIESGQTTVKATYLGGYIPEKTIVAAATPAVAMTIVNITSYASIFNLVVQTTGTAVAGNVTITGLDENGVAQVETIAITTAAGRFHSLKSWTSITIFNALAILGTGNTVKLVGNSFPDDIRAALLMHVSHLYQQDNDKTLNLTSRSVGQKTESGLQKGVPQEVKDLLNGYRRFSF